MMTDESVLEWASGWLRDNTPEDPTFRQRFAAGLRAELAARQAQVKELESELQNWRDAHDKSG